MSDKMIENQGPALSSTVHEVQGHFPNDATLQDAMGRITLLGLDRADLSVPMPHNDTNPATPDEAAAAPSSLDTQQIRTMASGITGTAAGMGLAAVLASGGLAAPIVVAAAGVGAIATSAVTSGGGLAADAANATERDRLGAEGKLILAARIRSSDQLSAVEAAMREAGATDVTQVSREQDVVTRGVNATGWTGL